MKEPTLISRRPIPPSSTSIGFRFRGGLADSGQLSFYEAGRYRYAAARLLYTIEHFRNTGEVVDRLTKVVDADFRITAPVEGSFLELVQQYALPIIHDAKSIQDTLHIPFGDLFSYVLSKVLPKASASDRLANIAEKQADAIEQLARSQQENAKAQQENAKAQQERERASKLKVSSRLNDFVS